MKEMLNEIELLTLLPLQIFQIFKVHRGNIQIFQQTETSTLLYLCTHLLVLIVLEMKCL